MSSCATVCPKNGSDNVLDIIIMSISAETVPFVDVHSRSHVCHYTVMLSDIQTHCLMHICCQGLFCNVALCQRYFTVSGMFTFSYDYMERFA